MRGRASKQIIIRLIAHSMSLSSRCGAQGGATGALCEGTAKSIAKPVFMHARGSAQMPGSGCRSSSRLGLGSSHVGLGSALGSPVVPLHLQRKVNVWSRSYNAEEVLASAGAPAGLHSSGKSSMYGSSPSALASATAVETETTATTLQTTISCNGSDVSSILGSPSTYDHLAPEAAASDDVTSSNGFGAVETVEEATVSSSSSSSSEPTPLAAEPNNEPAPAAAAATAVVETSSSSSSPDGASDTVVPSSSSSGVEESPVSGNGTGPAIRLLLQSGAAMLPHPDKAHRGGEDSFFIAEHQSAVGVADGVGGWAEIGVDAGAYARLLMVHAKEAADSAVEDLAAGTLSSQAILESAFYRTNVQGSSTACVLVVNGTTLSASNLGDSGFVLVRDGVATFQCPQQQHNFNFPFQLGSADSMSDQPQAAMRFDLQLQPGDIIVTGSDGLWDNIFAEEAATIASKCRDKGESATTAAQVLCRYARMRASDAKYHSPFSYAAIQAGYVYLGGKMDDITVVVSYVTLPHAKL